MHVGKIPASVSSAALLPLISLNRSRVSISTKRGWRTKREGFIMLVPVIIRLMDVN